MSIFIIKKTKKIVFGTQRIKFQLPRHEQLEDREKRDWLLACCPFLSCTTLPWRSGLGKVLILLVCVQVIILKGLWKEPHGSQVHNRYAQLSAFINTTEHTTHGLSHHPTPPTSRRRCPISPNATITAVCTLLLITNKPPNVSTAKDPGGCGVWEGPTNNGVNPLTVTVWTLRY